MAKYAILIYGDPTFYETASPEAAAALLDAHNVFAKAIAENGGTVLGGEALEPPSTATTIRGALDDLGHDVPALAVSVDPAHDTPDSAEAFLVKRGLSGGRMRFLLGTRAQLAPIWDDYGIQPQGNGFEHSAYVLLIDKRGRQRVSFPVQQLVDRDLAHDIRKLEGERA